MFGIISIGGYFFMNKYLEWLEDHKRQIFIIGGILLFILLLLGIILWKFYFHTNLKDKHEDIVLVEENGKGDIPTTDDKSLEDSENKEDINLVTIDIKGAVHNPGIYQIDNTSRVNDALNLAGGVRNDADLSVINLSKKVFDEMVIIIYTKDEVNNFIEVKKEEEEKQEKCVITYENVVNDACICDENTISNSSTSTEVTDDTSMISLNQATKEELMTLTGIGESKALLIIEYRETHNGFQTIDEVKNIKGIGDSIFEKIKDRITV